MKIARIMAAVLIMLCFVSCSAKSSDNESDLFSQNDPIYNDSATFNNLNEPSSSNEQSNASADAAAEKSISDAYGDFASAISSAEKLNSYRMSTTGAVAVEIENTAVELEKFTAKISIDSNSDFTITCQTDLKDNHNTSVSQTLESVYGNEKSKKMHSRTEYSSFLNSSDDYVDTKSSSYKRPDFSTAMGAVYGFKADAVESVTVTQTDGAATVKFLLKAQSAVDIIRTELSNAAIASKPENIKVEHFTVTAVIDAEGVLAACNISGKATLFDDVYTISRELSLSDKNSTGFSCIKPEWV